MSNRHPWVSRQHVRFDANKGVTGRGMGRPEEGASTWGDPKPHHDADNYFYRHPGQPHPHRVPSPIDEVARHSWPACPAWQLEAAGSAPAWGGLSLETAARLESKRTQAVMNSRCPSPVQAAQTMRIKRTHRPVGCVGLWYPVGNPTGQACLGTPGPARTDRFGGRGAWSLELGRR